MVSGFDTTILRKMTDTFLKIVSGKLRAISAFSRRHDRQKTSSLVGRFQAVLTIWGLVVYLVTATGFWMISSQSTERNMHGQANRWADHISDIVKTIDDTQEPVDYSSVIAYVENFPEIVYVKIFKDDGKSLLTEILINDLQVKSTPPSVSPNVDRRLFSGSVRAGKANREFSSKGNLLRLVAPVEQKTMSVVGVEQGKIITGYIEMGLDFSEDEAVLLSTIVRGSFIILLVFTIASLVARRIIKHSLKPLQDLREPLDRLARGETDVWVGKTGDEEIVAISNALNTTISAIKGRDAELRRLADYDSLTGLINKRSFNTAMEEERKRVLLEKDTSALLFIDLDQFKYVNDTVGHAAGDRLLVQIAELLKKRMRTDDMVCRLGGDEFAVLARSVDRDGALEIAGSIVNTMQEFLFVEQGKTFNVFCSVGIALMENDKFSAQDIFSNADMACYSAKSQGRNRFQFYEPSAIDKNKVDIGWSQRIADALTHDKFVLHYQPIVSIGESSQEHFEVLIRMQGDVGELVLPRMFIPVAERFGLAVEIDYWVIERSMDKLHKLNKAGRKVKFYINISGQLLIDPEFVERVIAFKARYEIESGQVVFEMAERAAIGNIHNASSKVNALKQHGFEFAVDDFGSGFSSFSYLKTMPVEYVKIDGEFVERILESKVDKVMVKSMIDIAKACDKKVVAEYVGEQESLEILKSYGVDYVQGFLVARPSPVPARFENWTTIESRSNLSTFK